MKVDRPVDAVLLRCTDPRFYPAGVNRDAWSLYADVLDLVGRVLVAVIVSVVVCAVVVAVWPDLLELVAGLGSLFALAAVVIVVRGHRGRVLGRLEVERQRVYSEARNAKT